VSSTSSKVILNLKDVSKRNIARNLHEMLEATKENLQQKRGILFFFNDRHKIVPISLIKRGLQLASREGQKRGIQ
jgi:hypothetical protein